MKRSPKIFNRLLWSVAIPEVLVFLVVGYLSFIQVSNILSRNNDKQESMISNVIQNSLESMDVSLKIVESKLDIRLEQASQGFVDIISSYSGDITKLNLREIQSSLGMDTIQEDVYIIDMQTGIIINCTFKKDLGLNVFQFGTDFKAFLHDVCESQKFVSEDFTIETSTRKLKKYSYQATPDKRYLFQIGLYSDDSNLIVENLTTSIQKIKEFEENLIDIDVFIGWSYPFSLLTGDKVEDTIDKALTLIAFEKKEFSDSLLNKKEIRDNHVNQRSEFILVQRDDATLFKRLVVKLKFVDNYEQSQINATLLEKSTVFIFAILILFSILFFNARFITRPITKISGFAKKVGEGDLSTRVSVSGSRELIELGNSFNLMTENLERSDREIREAHQEIKDSINYARRIQEAILPPTKLVKEYLTESFILYLPKDIVAGDFYWFDVQGDEVYFAAADCTGHGVPGAMVSVVCANALTRVVGEMKITEPAAILDKVRELVIQNFEKSEQEVKDGMDISFCRLNLKTRNLTYAGAHNPLYVVSRQPVVDSEIGQIHDSTIPQESPPAGPSGNRIIESNGYTLTEYKGDKQPIGKHAIEKPFTQHEIQLMQGDSIYISSDGYADQFGGPDGRKFMYKAFKRLLLSIQAEDPETQRQILLDTFNNWKGSENQIDDVCVIGVGVD